MWITEYGHEVKQDGEPKGVTRAQQAAYAAQAIGLAKADKRVDMFVWFVFRDHADERVAERPADRERRRQAGAREVARSRALPRRAERDLQHARRLDEPDRLRRAARVRDEHERRHRGRHQLPRLSSRAGSSRSASRSPCSAATRSHASPSTGFRPAKKTTYTVEVEANTANLDPVGRTLTLICS